MNKLELISPSYYRGERKLARVDVTEYDEL